MGDLSAVSTLTSVMNDTSGATPYWTRDACAEALSKIAENEGKSALLSIFGNTRTYWWRRRAAIRALDGRVAVDIFDINGDGLPDRILKGQGPHDFWYVQINSGDAFDAPAQWQGIDSASGSVFFRIIRHGRNKETLCEAVDINGDGLPDRVMKGDSPHDHWWIQLNTGTNFAPLAQWPGVDSPVSNPKWRAIRCMTDRETYADLFDINGDTLPDRVMMGSSPYNYWYVQLNNGSGFDPMVQWQGVTSSGSQRFWRSMRYVRNGRTYVDTFDINGDGLPDRLLHESPSATQWKIQFNNGIGFEPPVVWAGVSSFVGGPKWQAIRSRDDRDIVNATIADINADGLPDRVLRGDSPHNSWYVQYNTGTGFGSLTQWTGIGGPHNTIPYHSPQFANGANIAVMTLDMNGDGLLDRVIQSDLAESTSWDVQLHAVDTLPDLLVGIDNGKGGKMALEYTPSTRFTNMNLAFPIYVVTRAEAIDTIPTNEPPEVYCQELSYGGAYYHYEDREYRGFRKVRVTDPITSNYTDTVFHQGISTNEDCFKGRILEVTSHDGNGDLIGYSTNRWSRTTGGTEPNIINFVHLAETEVTAYEGTNSLTTKTVYGYDLLGNVTNETSLGDISQSGDEKTSLFSYALPYESGMNRLEQWELADAASVFRETQYRYDTRGNLVEKEHSLASGPNPVLLYGYDTYGNRISTADANGNASTTLYESVFHTFRSHIINAKGHTTACEYDPRFGVVTSLTDPNGNTRTMLYDPLGRKIEERDANGALVTACSYPDFNTRIRQQLTLRTEARRDGLDREYMTTVSGEEGDTRKDIVVTRDYNERGLLDRESLPHYSDTDSNDVSYVEYMYDIRGRIATVGRDFPGTDLDYHTHTHFVSPRVTKTVDPLGHTNTVVKDAYGNAVQVIEHTSGGNYTTTYSYDLPGNLVEIEDAMGNRTRYVYDSLGRQVSVDDPDSGTTSNTYDLANNLTSQTDNKGQSRSYSRDALNRITLKTCSDGSPPVTFRYDETSSSNGVGRLTTVIDSIATNTFHYDNEGRLAVVAKEIGSNVYGYSTSYDVLSRVTALTYPDGETVGYSYDDNSGFLEAVQGNADYVQNITYNDRSRMTAIALGHGVTTEYEYGTDGRLTGIHSTGVGGTFQDLDYTHDRNGNVLSIADAISGNTQSYVYDDLDRLVEAQNVPAADGSTRNLAYQYDPIGNLLKKGPLSLTYGSNAGPHAVTCLLDTNTETRTAITYDANGNMAAKGSMRLTFDADNRLSRVQEVRSGEMRTTSIPLEAGWNFFSLPLIPTNSSISNVFACVAGSCEQVSRFNTDGNRFEHYVGAPAFDEFHRLEYGRGYLVYLSAPCDLVVSGLIPTGTESRQMEAGYNLIAAPTFGSISAPEAMNNLVEGTNFDSVLAYTGSSYQQATNLQKGVSYYVHCPSNALWTVPPPRHVEMAFQYDSSGQRVRKVVEDCSVKASETLYVSPSYEIETDLGQTVVRKHIFAGSKRVCTVETMEPGGSAGMHYCLQDHLASSKAMVGESGSQTETMTYAPFGEVIEDTGSYRTKYKYTGKELDDTGLYYYGQRYYEPVLGRFTSPDTARPDYLNPQSLNRYAYCQGNPLKYIDPDGRAPKPFQDVALESLEMLDRHISDMPPGTTPQGTEIITKTAVAVGRKMRSLDREVERLYEQVAETEEAVGDLREHYTKKRLEQIGDEKLREQIERALLEDQIAKTIEHILEEHAQLDLDAQESGQHAPQRPEKGSQSGPKGQSGRQSPPRLLAPGFTLGGSGKPGSRIVSFCYKKGAKNPYAITGSGPVFWSGYVRPAPNRLSELPNFRRPHEVLHRVSRLEDLPNVEPVNLPFLPPALSDADFISGIKGATGGGKMFGP